MFASVSMCQWCRKITLEHNFRPDPPIIPVHLSHIQKSVSNSSIQFYVWWLRNNSLFNVKSSLQYHYFKIYFNHTTYNLLPTLTTQGLEDLLSLELFMRKIMSLMKLLKIMNSGMQWVAIIVIIFIIIIIHFLSGLPGYS